MESISPNASLSDNEVNSVSSYRYEPQPIQDAFPSGSRKGSQTSPVDGGRGSLVRRLSSAASSYLYVDDDNDITDLNDAISGTSHIYRAMSRRRDSESGSFGRSRASTVRRRSTIHDLLESEEDRDDALEAVEDAQGEPGSFPMPKRLKFKHKYGINSLAFKLGCKFKLWDDSADKETLIYLVSFFKNYFVLSVALLVILCIYWGPYYNRPSRYPNIHYPIYIADEGVPEQDIPPVLGPIVENFFTNFSAIAPLGTYDIVNMTQFASLASSHNISIEQEVQRQILHEKAYAGFLVHSNATKAYFDNLSGDPVLIRDSLMDIVLATGRDYNAVSTLVVPLMENINKAFIKYVAQTPLMPTFLQQLTDQQLSQVLTMNPSVITSIPNFKIVDIRPVNAVIFQAPLLIGVLYLCVFAFFQFLFMIPINQKVAETVKGYKYMLYRLCISQIAYLVISLGYVLLNTAFQMSFTTAFGRSGFLVIWMFGFLIMSALGSVIETLVLLLVPDRIHLMALVLIGTIVLNLAPTLAPLAFSNIFYRYGYAMPVYNAYRLMHVAYFDAWKGHVGRYIGVLVAWIVVANMCLPFSMIRVVRKIAEMKEEAAAAAATTTTTTTATAGDATKTTTDTTGSSDTKELEKVNQTPKQTEKSTSQDMAAKSDDSRTDQETI